MNNWCNDSKGGQKIEYQAERKHIASFLRAKGNVSKTIVSEFEMQFNKDYTYTLEMFESEQSKITEYNRLKAHAFAEFKVIATAQKTAYDKAVNLNSKINHVKAQFYHLQKMAEDEREEGIETGCQSIYKILKDAQDKADEECKKAGDFKNEVQNAAIEVKNRINAGEKIFAKQNISLTEVKKYVDRMLSEAKTFLEKAEYAIPNAVEAYQRAEDELKKIEQALNDIQKYKAKQKVAEKIIRRVAAVFLSLVIVSFLVIIFFALRPTGLNPFGLRYTMDEQLGGYIVSPGFKGITNGKTDLIIPEQFKGIPVVGIADETFKGNTNVISITIPNTVKQIGSYAFSECENLKTVIIGQNVTTIGDAAFSSCSSITEIVLPEGISSIGAWMFDNCTNLRNIQLPSNLTDIGQGAFRFCVNLTNIDIPISVKNIDQEAFSYCKNLTTVTIPEGITHISADVFRDCENLVSVTFPSTLESINVGSFINCHKVTEIIYQGYQENWIKIDKDDNWNAYFKTNKINCLDGEAIVYMIQWNLEGGFSELALPNEYIYGVGIPSTQLSVPSKDDMLFCGWYLDNVYTISIGADMSGDITLTAKWVQSSYSISSNSQSDTSSNKNSSYAPLFLGNIYIPEELSDLIAAGKVELIIRGEVGVSVQSQGNATATAYSWLVIAPNIALGSGYTTTDKCSQSATGGGYTSGFLGIGKEPKDGDKMSNTIDFVITKPILDYTNEIPIELYMQYESNKENSDVEISIWSYLNTLTYEFRVK